LSGLMFVGDPHGDSDAVLELIRYSRPQACLMLGDLCFSSPVESLFEAVDEYCHIGWIHGNHDTDRPEWRQSLFGSAWNERNFHGKVRTIAGIRIAGLGGIFRQRIWHPDQGIRFHSRSAWHEAHPHLRQQQRSHHHDSTIWPEEYEELAKQRADVLMLHEAPSSHWHGFEELDELAEAMGVRLIMHGHHHFNYRAELTNGVAVVGLDMGEPAWLDPDRFMDAKSAAEIQASIRCISH